MTLVKVLQDQDYSHRTQISLSKSMYRRLMAEKGQVSLAALIRKIITQYWQQQEAKMNKRQRALKVLSRGITGKAPSKEELVRWQRQLRQEKNSDEQ